MRERVTAMVLEMEGDMMVMLAVRGTLFVEATTVRSLATTIMTKMTAVNSQQPLLVLLLQDLHLPGGVPGVPSLPAQSDPMDTARKNEQDFAVITPVVILSSRRTGSVASLLAKHPTRFTKKRS